MLGPRKPRLTTGDPAGAPINDEMQRAVGKAGEGVTQLYLPIYALVQKKNGVKASLSVGLSFSLIPL